MQAPETNGPANAESFWVQLTLEEIKAVRDYRSKAGAAAGRKVPELVEEFLQERHEISKKWRRMLTKMLGRFAQQFAGPIEALRAPEVQDWIGTLQDNRTSEKLGPRSRNNYRNAIRELATWARDERKLLPKTWDELDGLRKEKTRATVNLYTPEEIAQLLTAAATLKSGLKLRPFIVLTAFCGVRHEEMNGEKDDTVRWEKIDWERGKLLIEGTAAKTGRDRVVDIPENARAWLLLDRRDSGKICSLKNTSNALCRLRQRAGIQGKKRNALRKSYITYSVALNNQLEGVALQAGNSPAIIRSNYLARATMMEDLAKRWFGIFPETNQKILPLFGAMKA